MILYLHNPDVSRNLRRRSGGIATKYPGKTKKGVQAKLLRRLCLLRKAVMFSLKPGVS